jgi:cell division protein FtsB
MAIELGVLILVAGLAISLWLGFTAQAQVKRLRTELDQTQRMLNEMRQQLDATQQQVTDLKAAAEVIPAPPPLPRARVRSGDLDDLREQLRAAHRQDEPASED